MTRAYGWLIVAIVVAALAISLAAHRPLAPARAAAPAPPRPAVALTLTVSDEGIAPALTQVPKDARIALTLVSHAGRPARITLAGYQDRVRVMLAPGATWRGSFVADLPGEGFAWLVDDEPAGRLAVLGSHLVEGHR